MSLKKRVFGIIISAVMIFTAVIQSNVFAATTDPVTKDPTCTEGITKVTTSIYEDPSTEMGFCWYTGRQSINSYVIIDKDKSDVTSSTDSTGKVIPTATPQYLISNKNSSSQTSVAVPSNSSLAAISKDPFTSTVAKEFVHKVTVKHLTPNTKYFYKVGDPDTGLWSEIGSFSTAPTNGAFTFADLADPQALSAEEAALAADTLTKTVNTVTGAGFIAINGDMVDTGSSESNWDMYFNDAQQALLNTVLVPVAGNHDGDSSKAAYPYSFMDHFNINPAAGSDSMYGAYYSFDYSNAHFVIVNNCETLNNTKNGVVKKIADNFSDAQINWMQGDITSAKSRGKEWTVVIMHKGPYSTSNHATDSDLDTDVNSERNVVAPMFARLGVDIVLQGHDHIYARSKPIDSNNHATTNTTITEIFKGQQINYQVNPDGAIYVIPGTGGPKVYYKNPKLDILGADFYNKFDYASENRAAVYGPAYEDGEIDPSRPQRSEIQNFISITIDGDKLSAITYEIDRGGYYSPNQDPYIIDTFGIQKTATANITSDSNTSVAERGGVNYTVSMQNLTNANAFDVSVKYDSSKLTYNNVKSLQNGLSVISQDDKDGIVNIIVGKTDKGVISGDASLIKLNFSPKISAINKDAEVTLLSASTVKLDIISGNPVSSDVIPTLDITTATSTINFASDVNGDGKITLADLSVALYYYMEDSSSSYWVKAKDADVNGDLKDDILDLQLIAGYIG